MISVASDAYSAFEVDYGLTTGRNGDDDGDGYTNEEEYFLGMNPMNAANLRQPRLVGNSDSPIVRYTYRRNADEPVSYTLSRSYNLTDWEVIHSNDLTSLTYENAFLHEPAVNFSDGTSTISIGSSVTFDSAQKQFFRIEAAY